MSGIDYHQYVCEDRIHSRIFTDPDVFEDELRRVFYVSWQYVAHASEIPEPGDYVVKWIGRQSLIVTRDAAGEVHLLMNRCRHRGTAVCQFERGNATHFRCPYHGWTYSNRGDLIGVPYPGSYDDSFDKSQLGLTPVPRSGSYNGFIFASLAEGGESLDDYLGHTKPIIDYAVAASPTGQIDLRAGAQRGFYRGNWKYVGMDGYHTNFTHKSVLGLKSRAGGTAAQAIAKIFTDRSPSLTWDLGHGHVRLDTAPSHDKDYEAMMQGAAQSEAQRIYLAAMREVHGERTAEILAESTDPHLGLWPNLQLIGLQVRVVRPIAADRTEVTIYPIRLKDVPDEINERRLRAHEWFYGPAGFGQPDDYELFERNQQGLLNEVDPWMLISRGLSTERHNPDGTIVGNITDEVTQRGQMREWLRAMTAGHQHNTPVAEAPHPIARATR